MFTVDVRIMGVRQFSQKIVKYRKDLLEKLPNDVLWKLSRELVKKAKELCPRRTGILAESISAYFMGKKHLVFQATAPWAIFQEHGFSPHNIPRIWIEQPATAGQWIRYPLLKTSGGFVRVSRHTPFMRPALNYTMTHLKEIIDKIHKSIHKKYFGR